MTDLETSDRDDDALGAPRTIRFKTYYWNYEETDENELFIHVGGRTEDEKSVHCVIKGFTPFVYLQLPKRIKWNKAKCIAVFEYLKKVMKSEGPQNYWLLKKYLLKHKKLCNTMCLTFPTNKAAYSLSRKCSNKNGMVIDGVGTFRQDEFSVHEQNIDPILKFTASKKLNLAGWIEVKETISDEELGMDVEDRKFTTADIDLHTIWTDVEAYSPKEIVIVKPRFFSFDIECYSKNHNSKLPDPDIPENCVFQIACTIGRFGEPVENSYLLSFGNPLDIPGVTMVRFNQGTPQQREKELLLYFKRLIDDVNPDVFVTFNGMKFDWNYMIQRAEKLGIYMKFAQISRIIGRRAELKKTSWSSSAYGEQEFRYLDPFGRTNVDVMIEIERNYKLPQYGLNAVAEFFLKEHKDDVTPRQLFMLYQLTEELTSVVNDLSNGLIAKDRRIEIKKQIQEILQMRRCHGEVKKLRTDLMNAKKGKEFQTLIRKAFAITGKYCVQDTVLPLRIAEKLNLWITMEEMSNCMNVPMSYLHTRGQQIKVLSQIYRETIFNDIIIPFRKKQQNAPIEKYQGAVVIEANPGDYENVVCYDFESLYPTTIIAFNICYTTLLEDDDPTPDEECHVIAWGDHVACIHDPQKRKKKAADVLCKEHRYRFRKVVTLPDGTRLHEGLMPRLERNLLSSRKARKKEMAKLEATYKMAAGLAMEDDIVFYKKMGWDIIEKGSLNTKQLEVLKVGITVRNAQQLTLKVSANSVRSDTAIPCKLDGTFKYLHIEDLAEKNSWTVDEDGNEFGRPLKGLKVWSDIGFTDVKYVFRHPQPEDSKLWRVNTHTGCIDVTESHSLLDDHGKEVTINDLNIGDKLLHECIPLPDDTPDTPFYLTTDEIITTHTLQTLEEKRAFVHGFFFAEGSCGMYGSLHANSEWTIYNSDLILLERVKALLKEVEPDYNFEIYDYREQTGVYHLRPQKISVELVKRYRDLFYNNRGRKVIPEKILGSSLSIRSAFFVGYYAGDGSRHLKAGIVVQNKGNLGTSQLYYLLRSLGYKVSILHIKEDIYRLQCCTKLKKEESVIKSINQSTGEPQIKMTKPDIVRNGEKLLVVDGICVYRDVNINCERIPRQKLLDSLDEAISCMESRGMKITSYSTKTKKITYECPECSSEYSIEWRKSRQKDVARHDRTCECNSSYIHPEKQQTRSEESGPIYVYDIETASHHFAAGIGDLIVHNSAYGGMGAQNGFIPLVPGAASVTAMGRMLIMKAIRYILDKYDFAKLVYGDTDSSMITFKEKSTEESFALGDKISRETSHFLKTFLLGFEENYEIECPVDGVKYRIDKYPRDKMDGLTDELKIHVHQYDSNPINLQFENLYKRYLLLSKKRYVAYAVNRKGEIINTIKKGVVLARRDNCQYLRDTYEVMVRGILDRKSEQEVMNILYDRVTKLFTRQIPDANLIIYTGVKNVMNYAKKKEVKNGRTVTDRVFLDEENEPIDDPLGPLDPRLVYPNYPQVLLSLKMLRRGDDIPPNTRLEYLYLENVNADYQGEKAEDYTFYRENKDIYNFKPDYLHYIEKQLTKPVTELIDVKYPRSKIPYEKLDNALMRCINSLDDLLKHRVGQVKKYERKIEERCDSIRCGWAASDCKKCIHAFPKKCKSQTTEQLFGTNICFFHNPKTEPHTYSYKGKAAQVQYILDSASRKKANPKAVNEIDEKKYPELIKICRRWKAWNIINACHAKYGIRKRTARRPTQTGEKLRLKTKEALTQVILVDKYQGYPKGTLMTLKGIRDEVVENSIRGKKKYYYQVTMQDGKVLDDVPREMFTTYYYKDSAVMKDILLARGGYGCVCEELRILFAPLNFGEHKEVKIFELEEPEFLGEDS